MSRRPGVGRGLCAAAAVLLVSAGSALAGHGDRVAVPSPGTDPVRWTSAGFPPSWVPGQPATTRPRAAASLVAETRGPASVPRAPVPTSADVACAASPGFPAWSAWGSYAPVAVSGSMLITRGGVPGSGSEADLDDTLGIDTGFVYEVGLAWAPFRDFARHRVFVAYERFAAEETRVLPSSVVFRDVLFPANHRVASKVEFDFLKAGYEALLHDDGRASLRAGVGGWLWRFQGTMQDLDGTGDQSRSFRHVLPVAHVAGEVRTGPWHAGASLSGGWIGDRRWTLGLSGAVGGTVWSRLRVEVGYRWTRFVFDETTNEGDVVFHGPFLGASLEF